ncbi:hypothetical protein GCM10022199_15380 [Marihabitans asiaticum]|uniref:Prevent-host-death family protein n=1 Tax=Marihabitans asiaticum TaxID=415218 RepID=A0A560W812_9MICO|nr:prevent-host-death family protein [Marihabitans asiaticum]TWD13772.1 hypothetical protein FB557_2405 [Marihabitans asiaticum]
MGIEEHSDRSGEVPGEAISLSQRELRNESGRVLRAVSAGASFTLTNGGVVVGRIVPVDAPPPALAITRPARRRGGWSSLGVTRATRPSLQDSIDELRADRV